MKLIFIGPPGAGKGTQAARICEEYNTVQLSTGDLFRLNRKLGTELGKKAQLYMDGGNLVPDEIVIGMLKDEIIKPEYSNGYILDGFPRTVKQAEALDVLLEELGDQLDGVLVLSVPAEALISRLTARRTCRSCNRSYHILYNPPIVPGVCDFDQGELYQRDDDQEEAIKNRLNVYEAQTKPLIDFYKNEGKVMMINGVGEIDEIYSSIKSALDGI
jgi:adenylate kinase